MPEGQGPATTRRRLRFELRRLREGKGLRQDEVVDKLDWSLSKLIRIENGSVGVSVTDVRALLGVYGATSDATDDLVTLARTARQRRWWSTYRDILHPTYQEFIGFEADAARLRQFHPTIVPGLLQTEDYVRESIEKLALRPLSEAMHESLVQVRLRRQQELLDSDDPPEFEVVIDEAALRRPVGGIDAMRDQLRHIAEVQQSLDKMTLGILPFSAGPHPGMQGAFHIMEFAADEDDDVLYLENATSDVSMRDQPELVSVYSRTLDGLLERSLRGDAALHYLEKISEELT